MGIHGRTAYRAYSSIRVATLISEYGLAIIGQMHISVAGLPTKLRPVSLLALLVLMKASLLAQNSTESQRINSPADLYAFENLLKIELFMNPALWDKVRFQNAAMHCWISWVISRATGSIFYPLKHSTMMSTLSRSERCRSGRTRSGSRR